MSEFFQFTVVDPGFPKRGAPTPEFGPKTYYLTRFLPKTAWEWKKIGPGRGGRASPSPPGSANGLLRNVPDSDRFPTVHMVKTHFVLENLWISEPSSGILEKIKCSWTLPNMKYNCAVLFFEWIVLVICAPKYIYSKLTIVKPSKNWLICSKTIRIYSTSWRMSLLILKLGRGAQKTRKKGIPFSSIFFWLRKKWNIELPHPWNFKTFSTDFFFTSYSSLTEQSSTWSHRFNIHFQQVKYRIFLWVFWIQEFNKTCWLSLNRREETLLAIIGKQVWML